MKTDRGEADIVALKLEGTFDAAEFGSTGLGARVAEEAELAVVPEHFRMQICELGGGLE